MPRKFLMNLGMAYMKSLIFAIIDAAWEALAAQQIPSHRSDFFIHPANTVQSPPTFTFMYDLTSKLRASLPNSWKNNDKWQQQIGRTRLKCHALGSIQVDASMGSEAPSSSFSWPQVMKGTAHLLWFLCASPEACLWKWHGHSFFRLSTINKVSRWPESPMY